MLVGGTEQSGQGKVCRLPFQRVLFGRADLHSEAAPQPCTYCCLQTTDSHLTPSHHPSVLPQGISVRGAADPSMITTSGLCLILNFILNFTYALISFLPKDLSRPWFRTRQSQDPGKEKTINRLTMKLQLLKEHSAWV